MGQARQHGLLETGRQRLVDHAQPAPEQVFLAWLMWLPHDADRRQAAKREIDRIDASRATGDGPRRLRALFADLMKA